MIPANRLCFRKMQDDLKRKRRTKMVMKNIEELRNMSREERMDYFKAHRSDLANAALEAASGGAAVRSVRENPNSSCPYNNCYYTSIGWICNGYGGCD